MVAGEILVIYFGVFGWVDSHKLCLALVLGHCLVYDVSVLKEACLSQGLTKIAIVLGVLLCKSLNQTFHLRVLHEVLDVDLSIARLWQRNGAGECCVDRVQFRFTDSVIRCLPEIASEGPCVGSKFKFIRRLFSPVKLPYPH